MGYRQPNRTATFFRQVDANKPAAARQKLGGAMGAQSVLQGQTGAQKQENTGVQQTQQQMQQAGTQGRESTSNFSGLGTATNVLSEGNKIVQGGTPVLQTSFSAAEKAKSNVSTQGPARADAVVGKTQNGPSSALGGIYTPVTIGAPNAPGGQAADRGYSLSVGQDANVTGNQIQGRNDAAVSGFNKLTDGTISRAGELKLGEELGAAYDKASGTLRDYEKLATEGNLGRLGAESAFEKEQADLAQVLADRQSNIGKLKSLYGVGYDTGKYGALDSNLLQGQFNEAATDSATNLGNREKARSEGDAIRESYLKESDNQKKMLDTTKEETQKRVTEIDGKLGELKIALEGLKGKVGVEAEKARAAIKTQATALETQRKDAVKTQTAALGGKRTKYELAGKLGISDKEAQKLTDQQVKDLQTIINVKPGTDGFYATQDALKRLPKELVEKLNKNNPGSSKARDDQLTKDSFSARVERGPLDTNWATEGKAPSGSAPKTTSTAGATNILQTAGNKAFSAPNAGKPIEANVKDNAKGLAVGNVQFKPQTSPKLSADFYKALEEAKKKKK